MPMVASIKACLQSFFSLCWGRAILGEKEEGVLIELQHIQLPSQIETEEAVEALPDEEEKLGDNDNDEQLIFEAFEEFYFLDEILYSYLRAQG